MSKKIKPTEFDCHERLPSLCASIFLLAFAPGGDPALIIVDLHCGVLGVHEAQLRRQCHRVQHTVIRSIISQRRNFLLRDVYADVILDGVKPIRETFHSLVVGCMKGTRLRDGLLFRDEMKSMGLPPDVNLYNLLVSTCGKCKNPDTAIKLLEEMKADGVKVKGETYICLLNTCTTTGWTDLVLSNLSNNRKGGLPLKPLVIVGKM